jgi:TPR repeat protein
MAKVLVFLAALLATPLYAAELGDSYVKLFQMQMQLARGGNAGAQYSLGEMYEQGLGTKEDLKKAFEWYEKAAAKGDVRARHKLASRPSGADDRSNTQAALAQAEAESKRKEQAARVAHEEKVKKAMLEKKRARVQAILEKQAQRQGAYEE